MVAGLVNLAVAVSIGSAMPSPVTIGAALLLGFLGYGVSLVLFIGSLRRVGTARTGAYFSIAPFIGMIASLVVLGEPIGASLIAGGALMVAGVWLHLTERHVHEHTHEPVTHDHRHVHDEHHRHDHPAGVGPDEPHAHEHEHERLTHWHHHYPDIHHRHPHLTEPTPFSPRDRSG